MTLFMASCIVSRMRDNSTALMTQKSGTSRAGPVEQDMVANLNTRKRFCQLNAAACASGDPNDLSRRASPRPQPRRLMRTRNWTRPFATWSILVAILVGLLTLPASPALGQGAGARIDEPPIPKDVDVFDLSLEQTRALSRSLNMKVVGHSYLKGPHLTRMAKAEGTGAGLNGVYVHDGIAYLSGYSDPPTLFGHLIVDVHNPEDMKVLSFIPCNPGTRCSYLRVNTKRHILVGGHSAGMPNAIDANPIQPPGGGGKCPGRHELYRCLQSQESEASWVFPDRRGRLHSRLCDR